MRERRHSEFDGGGSSSPLRSARPAESWRRPLHQHARTAALQQHEPPLLLHSPAARSSSLCLCARTNDAISKMSSAAGSLQSMVNFCVVFLAPFLAVEDFFTTFFGAEATAGALIVMEGG